jgi:hypothetical protein
MLIQNYKSLKLKTAIIRTGTFLVIANFNNLNGMIHSCNFILKFISRKITAAFSQSLIKISIFWVLLFSDFQFKEISSKTLTWC